MIYVVFGAALVVLAVALHRLLQPMASLAVSIGTPFGLIWVGLVVTIVPALSEMGAIFGLLQIVWFVGIGVVLLRANNAQQIVAADI